MRLQLHLLTRFTLLVDTTNHYMLRSRNNVQLSRHGPLCVLFWTFQEKVGRPAPADANRASAYLRLQYIRNLTYPNWSAIDSKPEMGTFIQVKLCHIILINISINESGRCSPLNPFRGEHNARWLLFIRVNNRPRCQDHGGIYRK